MSYEIIEKLKQEIAGFKSEVALSDVGLVTESGDGIVKISGLPNALSQELLLIETEAGIFRLWCLTRRTIYRSCHP